MLGFKKPSRKVFISYSSRDKRSKEQLRKNFAPFTESGKLNVWIDESKIDVGDDWEKKLDKALKESELAVLLMSENFFDSEYIREKELPFILKSAQKKRMSVVPVLLKDCGWKEYKFLNKLQVIGASKPLMSIQSLPKRQKEWQRVVNTVAEVLKSNPARATWVSLTTRWTLLNVLGAFLGFSAAFGFYQYVGSGEMELPAIMAGFQDTIPIVLIALLIALFQFLAVSRYIARAVIWSICSFVGLLFLFEFVDLTSISLEAFGVNLDSLFKLMGTTAGEPNDDSGAIPFMSRLSFMPDHAVLVGGLIGFAQSVMVWTKYAARNYFWWFVGSILWVVISAFGYSLGINLLGSGVNRLNPVNGILFGGLYGLLSSPILFLLINRIARRKQS